MTLTEFKPVPIDFFLAIGLMSYHLLPSSLSNIITSPFKRITLNTQTTIGAHCN